MPVTIASAPRSRGSLLALGLALLAAATLASCGRDSQVLARVGNRTITAGEFLDYARTAGGRYPWLPDSAKRMLLQDIIRRDLMLEEAEQRGLMKPAAVQALRSGAEDELLVGAMSDALAPRDIPVSAAEIDSSYRWRKTEYKLQVIYAPEPRTADAARSRLLAGEPFDQLALRFNVTGMVPANGELGWVPGGAMPEPLDTRMRESRIGEIIGPLRVGSDSWFIARVQERRPAAQPPPLPAIREQLIEQIRDRKRRAIIQRAIESLTSEYGLKLEPGGAQALFMRANRAAGDSSGIETPADAQTVLARYEAVNRPATYTLADALADLQGPAERPNFSSVPALERWIESRVVRRLLLIEAKRRHLHEDPAVARGIEDRVEGAVLQSLYDTEIASQIQVTEADMRAEYQRRVGGMNPRPFEAMPPELREQLRSLTLETKRDERLKQFTSALRSKYPVAVNEALLRRLEWPAAQLAPGAPQG